MQSQLVYTRKTTIKQRASVEKENPSQADKECRDPRSPPLSPASPKLGPIYTTLFAGSATAHLLLLLPFTPAQPSPAHSWPLQRCSLSYLAPLSHTWHPCETSLSIVSLGVIFHGTVSLGG